MGSVPAAAQALAVLRYMSAQAGPVPAAAIGRDVGLPRSTTYHLLDTLIAAGFVVHVPEDRRYGLGLAAYELGSGYARQAPLQRLARIPLARLVDRTGHNAHLAVLHGREVVYLIEERARGRPPLVTDVGVRLPAQLTASGRAMLAYLPPPQLRALFGDPAAFVLRNERGPRSISALRQLLAGVRRRGYAQEAGEVTPGFGSVSVAVFDHSRHPVAAVAITYSAAATESLRGPRDAATIEQVDREHVDQLVRQVERTARELSRRIGGQ